jgi:hypothetical protein
MRLSVVIVLAIATIHCHSASVGRTSPVPLDSARAVALAMAVVADTSDTLVDWAVTEYSHGRDGYMIHVAPTVKRKYVGQVLMGDGDGIVHISNDGKISLIDFH